LEVTALLSMTRQAAGAVDFVGMEPKKMSTGLASMSVMLSGKIRHWSKPSSCTKNLEFLSYMARQLSDGEI
jgi:hypothetical protein